MDSSADLLARLQKLEKWQAVAELRIKRVEDEQKSTIETRENFARSMDAKLDKFGGKIDEKIGLLDGHVNSIQRKLWFAGGVIVCMQFVAPIILKLTKVL